MHVINHRHEMIAAIRSAKWTHTPHDQSRGAVCAIAPRYRCELTTCPLATENSHHFALIRHRFNPQRPTRLKRTRSKMGHNKRPRATHIFAHLNKSMRKTETPTSFHIDTTSKSHERENTSPTFPRKSIAFPHMRSKRSRFQRALQHCSSNLTAQHQIRPFAPVHVCWWRT